MQDKVDASWSASSPVTHCCSTCLGVAVVCSVAVLNTAAEHTMLCTQHTQVEDISNLLNTGEVPNLFDTGELLSSPPFVVYLRLSPCFAAVALQPLQPCNLATDSLMA
jgi:hypothetical protein